MHSKPEVRSQKSEVRNQQSIALLTSDLRPPTSSFPTSDLRPLTSSPRSAFTLTELLIVIAIVGIMTGLGLSALAGATEQAREQRTRSIIAKLDQLIMDRYESYRTRAVPIRVPAGLDPRMAARMRLYALRDLMRMEMPDRKSDVVDVPCDYDPRTGSQLYMKSPSLRNSYLRQVNRNAGSTSNWSLVFQSSECLYLIVSTIQDGDKNALDFFTSDEIGDTDGDGMKEILDSWGNPILFLRWPSGYTLEQPGDDWTWGSGGTNDPFAFDPDTPATKDFGVPMAAQSRDYRNYPDAFDPLKADPRWEATNTNPQKPFLMRPLILSAGRDKQPDIVTDSSGFSYSPIGAPNNAPDPYALISVPLGGSTVSVPIGTPTDADSDGEVNFVDNITNHNPVTP